MIQTRILTAALAVLLVYACASNPESADAVQQARSTVEAASADPAAVQLAALDIQQARELLTQAEQAQERGDDKLAEHYAFLADRNGQLAVMRGRGITAERRASNADVERQRVQLQAREAQAARARQQLQQQEAENARLANQVSQLSGQLSELSQAAKQTPRGIVLTLGDVLFDTAKAELKPGAARTIDQLAEFLTTHQERRVVVEGFTDSVGSEDYNQTLSQRRADAVRMAVLSRGIESERVTARGYGEAFPVAGNASAGERQLNRRVEIVISNDDQAVPERQVAL